MYWWVSTEKFTCWVETKDGKVIRAAPLLQQFIGRPFKNVEKWCRTFRGYRCEEL